MTSFFIGKDNKATIVCPGCGKSKIIDATRYMGDGPVKIKFKLKCGYCAKKQQKSTITDNEDNTGATHIITLERRKFYRKKVNLPGTFIDSRGKRGGILIIDLSRTGLKFKLEFPWPLELEDRVTVEFHLDNASKTFIKKESRVKKIDDMIISVQFLSANTFKEADKAIGFYLMN